MADRVSMSRLVRGRAPGREFDIAFWQKLGPTRILEAAWDLVVTAAAPRGIDEDQLHSKDLLRTFNVAGVRYLIVGGYAVMIHTEPRYTKHLDLWIEPEEANAAAVLNALAKFGAPTDNVILRFAEPEVFFQIGVEPVRIDIMTSVLGLGFTSAWNRRIMVGFERGNSPGDV